MVTKLIKYPPIPSGAKTQADEKPTVGTYYDGSHKLNTLTINCRVYVNKKDCLHKSACGWCGQTNSCISGTSQGPLEACLGTTYKFSTPDANEGFNPKAALAAENYIGTTINVHK